jgi:hypothetical protein
VSTIFLKYHVVQCRNISCQTSVSMSVLHRLDCLKFFFVCPNFHKLQNTNEIGKINYIKAIKVEKFL